MSATNASETCTPLPLSDLLRQVHSDIHKINGAMAEVSANLPPGMDRMLLFEAVAGMQRVQASIDLLAKHYNDRLV